MESGSLPLLSETIWNCGVDMPYSRQAPDCGYQHFLVWCEESSFVCKRTIELVLPDCALGRAGSTVVARAAGS